MKDDIFEEDLFEEELSEEQIDADMQYILSLMTDGLAYCEQAAEHIDQLIKLVEIMGEQPTGIPLATLHNMKHNFATVLPDLISGEGEEELVRITKDLLNVSDDFARNYIENTRNELLENISKYKDK